MKTEKPTNKTISAEIRSQITIDLPEGEIDDIIETCDDLCSQSYDAGYNLGMVDGAQEYENDNPAINEEKLCTEYIVEKFGDCKTLGEFIEVYNELRNISYTYIR